MSPRLMLGLRRFLWVAGGVFAVTALQSMNAGLPALVATAVVFVLWAILLADWRRWRLALTAVSVIYAGVMGWAFWPSREPPPGPFRIGAVVRVMDSKTLLLTVNRLVELNTSGRELLVAAEKQQPQAFDAAVRAWAQSVLDEFAAAGWTSEALLFSSDIGVESRPVPKQIPAANRIAYYNAWFRLSRLQDVLLARNKELESRRDLILLPPGRQQP